jgi:hypothetical protein
MAWLMEPPHRPPKPLCNRYMPFLNWRGMPPAMPHLLCPRSNIIERQVLNAEKVRYEDG